MRAFHEIKNELDIFFESAKKCAEALDFAPIAGRIEEIRAAFLKKEIIVVTCGEMKRGKSSMLTAFLEEAEIFPVDIDTCTNVITIVQYGETEKIEVILEKNEKDQTGYESVVIDRSRIREFVTEYGNANNHKRVSCLNVITPNPKLKEGYLFVDTPGLGSLHFEHAQITQAFLPNADVMLFVSDALNPFTDSELDFLGSAYKYCTNIVFILTKTDLRTKDEIDLILSDNRSKIGQRLRITPEKVVLIPVSSKARLRYASSGDPDQLAYSNFPALEEAIRKTIYDNRMDILLAPYLNQLLAELAIIRGHLDILSASLNQNREKAKNLEKIITGQIKQLNALLKKGARWKGDLRYELKTLFLELSGVIREHQSALIDEMTIHLSVIKKVNPEEIQKLMTFVNSSLSNLVYTVREEVLTRATQINTRIYKDIGLLLEVRQEALEEITYASQDTVQYAKSHKSLSGQFVSKGRNVAMSSLGAGVSGGMIVGTLTVAAGILGAIFGGPPLAFLAMKALAATGFATGAAIGSTVGVIKGVKDVFADARLEDVPAIRAACTNYIYRSTSSIRDAMSLTLRKTGKIMFEDLVKQIKSQAAQLQHINKETKKNYALNATQVEKEKTRLSMFAAIVQQLESESQRLSAEILK